MTRILATLATLSMLGLAAALVIGLSIGDLYERPHPDAATLNLATVHRLTGVAAALGVVFVESVVVTYFIGTSRWCREVVETYDFDPEIVRNSNRLKRRTFPWALGGMLAVVGMVGIIALGGAADPATGRLDAQTGQLSTAAWVPWHLAGALCGIALVAWTYVVAWNNVFTQHTIIQNLVRRVALVREKRGLEDTGPPVTSENRQLY
jgi:hypothetical protein